MAREFNILCLSSNNTAEAVLKCGVVVNRFRRVQTVAEARAAIKAESFDILIAALGNQPDRHLIQQKQHDNQNKVRYESPLFHDAIHCRPEMMRIVYSHTACKHRPTFETCMHVGADAVLSSHHDLVKAIELYFSIAMAEDRNDDENGGEPCAKQQSRSNNFNYDHARVTWFPTLALGKRKLFESRLLTISHGLRTRRFELVNEWTNHAGKYLSKAKSHLRAANTNAASSSCNTTQISESSNNDVKNTIRVVHVSDTHYKHRAISRNLPSGDLFLHTGDICGNYDPYVNLRDHLIDFLQWLETDVIPKFEKVVFIAGNHDVLLDPQQQEEQYYHCHYYDAKAEKLLQGFIEKHSPKVSYLCDTSTTFRGLSIYGSPTCVSRLEAKGKRYLSNAFERFTDERRKIWKRIPDNVDILLTHCPPGGISGGAEKVCGSRDDKKCSILGKQTYQKRSMTTPMDIDGENIEKPRRAPALHAFGHCHTEFGIAVHEESGTVLSNGCQGLILDYDEHCGGLPWVFDLTLPTTIDR